MAILSTNASARETVAATIGRFAERALTLLQQRRVYRVTLNELRALTDRELDDLGIARSDIPMVARKAADL